MTGEANWLFAVVVLVAMAALGLLWAFGVQFGRYFQWRKTKTVCPASGATVDVTFVSEAKTGRVVDVSRCAVFADPNNVQCQKRCIEAGTRARS